MTKVQNKNDHLADMGFVRVLCMETEDKLLSTKPVLLQIRGKRRRGIKTQLHICMCCKNCKAIFLVFPLDHNPTPGIKQWHRSAVDTNNC